ncbi:hypothetical protein BGZ80_004147 [Entomortierella chlamydospora]|uniref:Uncharacterized protein n=1 Tax=Entomortierella chlamydospora TaxID=101097 RepID=A0A9P6MMF3_9FUNG|nr:hypothetical protein BGZ80_004147 [Entomortierella chlamydospora]
MVERVHVVTAIGVTRWNSRMFKFNIALVAPFSVIVVLAIKFRVAEIDDLGYCQIGLQTQASAPLIVYDTLINVWLTFLFMRSLISSTSKIQGSTGSKLRAVTQRTLIGAILSLILSSANIASFVVFNGHERDELCLALCTLDVTLNAVTIHWVTSPRRSLKASVKSTPNRDWPSKVDSATMEGQEVSPLRSHLSISIESYVEEYHPTHGPGREYSH